MENSPETDRHLKEKTKSQKKQSFWASKLPETFRKDAKIHWYRSKVDPQLMRELMQCSDGHGLRQAVGHIGLWFVTGIVAYMVFRQISAVNWLWTTPVVLVVLFIHGTIGAFFGGAACHELSHKTPFKTKFLNEFFYRLYAFFSWHDLPGFRPSHVRHHQVTAHHDYDGEVVLPQQFNFRDWEFWLGLFAWNPLGTWNLLKTQWHRARGVLDNSWFEFVIPEENPVLRRRHRNWARFLLLGHLALAAAFIASGHWFLVIVFNFGTQYCGWLGFLTHAPQHYGMLPDVSDHRLACRTYKCSWLPAFLYWNMQYHVEHHMFPGVPFFNLPKLHHAIERDLPPTPHGLHATWRQMLDIHRQQQIDPNFQFVPDLPVSEGTHADDLTLQREAGSLP